MASLVMDKVAARVVWLMGARLTNGSFSGSTADDDRFDDEEVKRAIIETESEIIMSLLEAGHPQRIPFLAWSADLAHGDTIPAHFGNVEAVRIKAAASDTVYAPADAAPSFADIRSWRDNTDNAFGSLNHTTAASPLAGYYYILNNTIYFTGTVAQVKTGTVTPNYTSLTLSLSDAFEGMMVAGAIPRLVKTGVDPDVASVCAGIYQQGIARVFAGRMPEAQDLLKAGAK